MRITINERPSIGYRSISKKRERDCIRWNVGRREAGRKGAKPIWRRRQFLPLDSSAGVPL
jgi:hypothetical protein